MQAWPHRTDVVVVDVCVQVLSAAGAVNHEELVKLASEAFGSVPDEDATTSVRSLITKVGGRVGVEERWVGGAVW